MGEAFDFLTAPNFCAFLRAPYIVTHSVYLATFPFPSGRASPARGTRKCCPRSIFRHHRPRSMRHTPLCYVRLNCLTKFATRAIFSTYHISICIAIIFEWPTVFKITAPPSMLVTPVDCHRVFVIEHCLASMKHVFYQYCAV